MNKRGAAIGDGLQIGFNTASDVISFHCQTDSGRMHPRFVPDLTNKDSYGNILMDKFPRPIGVIDESEGN